MRLGVLETVRSKPNASSYAKKQKIPVKHVPRFAIHIPGKIRTPDKRPSGAADSEPVRTVRRPAMQASSSSAKGTRLVALDDKSDYARVFVANLPSGSSEDSLMKAMSIYGTVVDVKVPKDPVTNRIKGFGFVEFDKSQDAATAIEAYGGVELAGRYLVVRRAIPKGRTIADAH